MASRSLLARVAWTSRDFAKRVWDNSGEDNIFFLAGGIAFNIMLAAIPFFLLLVAGLAYLLGQSTVASLEEVALLVERLLPPGLNPGELAIHRVLGDVIAARGSLGLYSAIGFIWFSTRLFGSLRSVLADVFDLESERGIVEGKLFDIKVTVVSTILVAAYTVLSTYLAFATTRGIAILGELGVRRDVMGQLEYTLGRLIAFAVVSVMFFLLYKLLPNRRVRWQMALIAALFTAVLFELARSVYTAYVERFNPGSLYSGTLYVIVTVVFWVYYSSLLFVLGGEVAQVYELRRVRRIQREVLEA
ncbi:MAG TPA: YihY/virulence factor BrkB family protein [Gemmatimonadaceae bacterium]|nr:YihY/virulence factor BrkB family protein [Gemmatimonadaceae bacterium]